MAVYTLFSQAGGTTLNADQTDYTFGVQFSVNTAGCTLTAIWFYSASGALNLPTTIALYAVSGQSLVVSQAPSWSGALGSGWVRAPFTSPPALTSGVQYEGCVLKSNVNANAWYSSTANYWSSGAGSGGITNGPLSAPNNGGSANGQDCYNQASALAYPASTFNATNYWVDPEITTTGGAPAGPAYTAFMASM
jgi:uncharacterized protein DUF4082